MSILIRNVYIVNAGGVLPKSDILVEEGKISKIGTGLTSSVSKTIDAEGLFAFPGFCDLHCHLRDPGFTHKEDIATGTKSAAAGGFTSVCCMPNTKPVCDAPKIVKYIAEKAQKEGFTQVLPIACITKGMKGKQLTDFSALKAAGAAAFSDDGLPVQDNELIRQAMLQAKEQDVLLMLHEEDLKNRGDGVAHDGENAKKAGLSGISRAIEDAMTARDLYCAMQIGARVHFCHVSTIGSIELIRRAKAAGANVTCETGPHYFSLTDAAILTQDPNTKVNPPLREEEDRQAVIRGIADGTIDAIATDHAPHHAEEKSQGFLSAPFGLIGFETAFALAVTNLYRTGKLELSAIARLLSAAPRNILGIGGGEIAEGEQADIAICNIADAYVYQERDIVSKAHNSPFIGQKLYGKVRYTIAGGCITYGR